MGGLWTITPLLVLHVAQGPENRDKKFLSTDFAYALGSLGTGPAIGTLIFFGAFTSLFSEEGWLGLNALCCIGVAIPLYLMRPSASSDPAAKPLLHGDPDEALDTDV